jgi:CRP-like cAMP-binding protein
LKAHDWHIVRRSPLFEKLPDSAVRALVGMQTLAEYDKGVVLHRPGEASRSGFLILQGIVKLLREGGSSSGALLAMHGPGSAFFVGEALAGSVSTTTAEAVTPTRVLVLDAKQLRAALATDPKMSRAMMAAAAGNLRQMVAQIEELKTRTAPVRLANFILGLSGARTGSDEVALPYEKQLIAERLGVTSVSLSRALRELAQHGVSTRGDKILIDDVAALRAFAN